MIYTSRSTEETKIIASNLAQKLVGGEVLCLYGNLGAGKTVFAQGVINFFLPGKRILSPTFIIVRHYRIPDHPSGINEIFHYDLYRLSEKDNDISAQIDEFDVNQKSVFIIEWAEKLAVIPGRKIISARITQIDNQTIKIDLSGI